MHVQFRSGTTLEEAHSIAHSLQDTIRGRLRGADVLIHLEPEDSVRPGTEMLGHAAQVDRGRRRAAQRRLIAAETPRQQHARVAEVAREQQQDGR